MSEHSAEKDAGLTDAEHALVEKLGSLMADFSAICGEDTTRQNDMFEVMLHVHGLQNMVLSQAAPRLYPDRYRGMGTRITPPKASEVAS